MRLDSLSDLLYSERARALCPDSDYLPVHQTSIVPLTNSVELGNLLGELVGDHGDVRTRDFRRHGRRQVHQEGSRARLSL